MKYRYETHLHTAIGSACSCFRVEEIVEKYVRLGYTGLFVTDHFLNGNTTVSRELPYEEQIVRFSDSWRAVKRGAEGRLDVFFGFEYSYKGTDFLVYGLDEAWLLSHPEIMAMSARDFCRFARSEGGLVVQAHPFREAFYIDHIRLFPSDVDGMEVINSGRDDRCNRLAGNLADEYALGKTAGSDIHSAAQVSLAGMDFETPLRSETDFVMRVKAGEGEIFCLRDE